MIKHYEPSELLGLDKFQVDEGEPHIVLDKKLCAACPDKACLKVCPAGLYTLKNGEISFDCAGCLECGTCRLVCSGGGIVRWTYPRGSFGLALRQG